MLSLVEPIEGYFEPDGFDGNASEREFINNNDNLMLGLNVARSGRGSDAQAHVKFSLLPRMRLAISSP